MSQSIEFLISDELMSNRTLLTVFRFPLNIIINSALQHRRKMLYSTRTFSASKETKMEVDCLVKRDG